MGGNYDSFNKNWIFIGCYSGNGRYNYYRNDIWNSMDSNGLDWPIIGFWHVGGSSWDSTRKEEPVRILSGQRDKPGFQQDGRRRGC